MTTTVQLYSLVWQQRIEAFRCRVQIKEGSLNSRIDFYVDGHNVIVWALRQGITGLLHEAGHLLGGLEHRRVAFATSSGVLAAVSRLQCEREASVIAEELARTFGVSFNYEAAEDWYSSYLRAAAEGGVFSQPAIKWRYK